LNKKLKFLVANGQYWLIILVHKTDHRKNTHNVRHFYPFTLFSSLKWVGNSFPNFEIQEKSFGHETKENLWLATWKFVGEIPLSCKFLGHQIDFRKWLLPKVFFSLTLTYSIYASTCHEVLEEFLIRFHSCNVDGKFRPTSVLWLSLILILSILTVWINYTTLPLWNTDLFR